MCRRLIFGKLLIFNTQLASEGQSFPTRCVNVYLGGIKWLMFLFFVYWVDIVQVVPHQPVKCTVLDALGRLPWSANVGGPMELPGTGPGRSFPEFRSGARAEIHRLLPH